MRVFRLLLVLLIVGAASAAAAATPDGALRVFAMRLDPSGDFSGNVLATPSTLEGESTVGLGLSYEVRGTKLFGVEYGLLLADVDFKIDVAGTGGDFGSALYLPLTVGFNFHVLRRDRWGVHVGPVLAYTFWGTLDTDAGPVELDREFDFGAKIGLEAGRGRWNLYAAVASMTAEAGDSSLTIPVDPLLVHIGVTREF